MWGSSGMITSDLRDLEMSISVSRSLRFWFLLSIFFYMFFTLKYQYRITVGDCLAQSHLNLGELERLQSMSLKFLRLICRKGAGIGHMLLLSLIGDNILDTQLQHQIWLGWPSWVKVKSLKFGRLVYHKAAKSGHIIKTNRKCYNKESSPSEPSHITLDDIESSNWI